MYAFSVLFLDFSKNYSTFRRKNNKRALEALLIPPLMIVTSVFSVIFLYALTSFYVAIGYLIIVGIILIMFLVNRIQELSRRLDKKEQSN